MRGATILRNKRPPVFPLLAPTRTRARTVEKNKGVTNDVKSILADPLLVAPGSGQAGLDSVAGYKLRIGSPALNACVPITGNGGPDYLGKPVSAQSAPHPGARNDRPITK